MISHKKREGDCPLPIKQSSVVEDTRPPCRAAERGLHKQESDRRGTASPQPPSRAGDPSCREAAGWLLCRDGRWWPLPLGPRRLQDSGWKHEDRDAPPALEKTIAQTDRHQGGPGREGARGWGAGLPLDLPRTTVRHGSPELADASQQHHREHQQKQQQLTLHRCLVTELPGYVKGMKYKRRMKSLHLPQP